MTGQVDDVIADEGGFFRLEIFFLQNFAEGAEFIGDSLVDVLDLEVAGTQADGVRDALGDDSGLEASEAGERKGGAVVGMEALGLDRGIAAGWDEEYLAVGHDPIDIQQQELYLLCTRL